MIIDYLGHSEVLINMKNSKWETVKILSDTWLSSYSVADLMQRNPIVNINYDLLETVDAVFISHSHMDHLDPYSLINIFSKLKNKPILLLPETLAFTKDLFLSELDCDIKILKNKEDYEINGVVVRWYIFPDISITNEADVMTLSVRNNEEIVFSEIDIIPWDFEEGIWEVYKLFTEKDYKTRLYLSTRNELECNLQIVDLAKDYRGEFAQEYRQKRIWEIYDHYNNILAMEEEWIWANIYNLPWFVRWFVGQGIIFPVKEFGTDALKLQIMSLDENVKLETEISNDFGIDYPMYALNKVWEQIWEDKYEWLWRYIFTDWDLQKIEKTPYLEWEYYKAEQDLNIDFSRNLKKEPVLFEVWKEDYLKDIEKYLNTRFLAYQLGRIDANLKNLALENKWKYIIQLKNWKNDVLGYFVWTLWSLNFEFIKEVDTKYNETYYFEDIVNFLEWKIELYSNFWSYLESWTNIYLWECLWADFLNNDILLKKYNYHFTLAKSWISQEELTLKVIKKLFEK